MGFLDGKVAVVTGGNRGIGRAIVEGLAEEGARDAFTARGQSAADRAAKEIGHDAFGVRCDVRSYEMVQRLFREVEKRAGGVDILVNNAGIGIFNPVSEMDPQDWRAVVETNLNGVFYCCREAIPHMKRRGGGYIFNISSLAGKNPFANGAGYNASKFGLNGFSEALMMEVRYDNIRVSYLMPGSVATDFGSGSTHKSVWALQPGDVASVVMGLLQSPERAHYSRVEMRPSRPPKKC